MSKRVKILMIRVGGTNCDAETKRSLVELGAKVDVLHMNEIVKRKDKLTNYDALIIPGGFSFGDYVRAGAVWAKLLEAKLGKEIRAFVSKGKAVLGICNGFQVLIEMGLLPDLGEARPEATLAPNIPPGYNCRWVYVRHESSGKCVFTRKIPKGKVLRMPIAHSEGRLTFSKEREQELLKKLCEDDQLVLRYCRPNGEPAEGDYPFNPNGSFHDIAGICDSSGLVFGLMPHPERAFYVWQQPNWTREKAIPQYGDGKLIFEGLIDYLTKSH